MTGRMKLRLVVAVALVGWARALSVRGVPEVQAHLAPHVPRDDDLACIISGTEAATLLQLRKQAPPSGVHRVEGAFSVDLGRREARACAVHPEGLTPLLDNLSVTAEAPSATWEELAKAKKRGGAWRLYGAELQLAAASWISASRFTIAQSHDFFHILACATYVNNCRPRL